MSKALATKKVAAVLLGFGMVLTIAGVANAQTTTTTSNSSTLATLQAQVQALLAQIASLQGTGTATTGTTSSGACFTFTQNESLGASGGQVMWIQEFLNGHGYTIAASGAGSPGNESTYFGSLTKAAIMKFQSANGITPVSGYWGPLSRAKANAICAGSTTTTTTTTGTTSTGGGITVTAGTQPANSLAPALANRVPFTTFTLTNNSGAAVTINGIDIQRTGLAADAAFAGVELIDPNGIQIGTSRTFNSNHQVEVGTPFTLAAGQSETFTIAGNMQNSTTEAGYAGQVASLSVVGIDTTVPVSGTLPITGAQQTINSSLAIGTATAQRSSFDPLSPRSEPIGTTALIFSGIRVTAGSAENEKLYSITWNQTGSVGSADLGNLVTVVNGTSYPMTVDSTGKYYTASFPGGITINEGNSVDAYVEGNIIGSDASGRTVEFDIYRQTDIYLVGQTYGYGITATPSSITNTTISATNNSGFYSPTNSTSAPGQPFFEGAQVSVTAGTLSTVSNAGSVGSQNIAINVPNQPLGGFTTNFTGEPVTVQTLTFHVASSTAGVQLQNVSLVDSNGNVVAGPVNETDSTATIVFNSSVTFPVGTMTYTLKGTVASYEDNGTTPTPNGITYTISTNPSSDWTSPQGETSGSTVSFTGYGSVTMSTMTVQAGSLAVSAASTPASTTVAPGANNFVIANINLDASQSGEDVRLSSIPVVIDATSSAAATALKSGLTNCQLWNGSTSLNSQAVGSSQWAAATLTSNTGAGGSASTAGLSANFVFTNAITIPKGTVTVLSLECNISSSLSGTNFAAGVDTLIDTNTALVPTGAQSGNSITASVSGNSVSGTMTLGTASLTATVPTALSFADVAGGSTGVTVGTFTLQPTSDSVNLQNIGLALNSNNASSSDVARAYIYNGSTQVGSVIFTGSPTTLNGSGHYYLATSTISNLSLPQNQQTTLTIKADINAIGPSSAATDGHKVVISLANAQGVGASSGTSVNSGTGSGTQTGVNIYRTFPTVATGGSSSGTLLTGTQTLEQFSVTANAGGSVGLQQFGINVATSTGSASQGTTTVTALNVYAYTDSGYSVAAPGTANGGLVGTLASLLNSGTNVVTFSGAGTPVEIPAGTTYYFKVTGTVTQVAGSSSTHGTVQTYLAGDATNLAPSMFASNVSTLNTSNFVWSPNATTTVGVAANDWTNGYGLSGLPSSGITPATTLSN